MRSDIVFQVPMLSNGKGKSSRGLQRDDEQEDQEALLQAGKRDSRHGSPVFTVLFCIFVSVFLVATSMDSLINNLDDRIFVTTTESFSNLFALRDVFSKAYNYSRQANPPSLLHGVFDPMPDTMQEWQDLRNRRIMSSKEYDDAVKVFSSVEASLVAFNGPSLLWNLLRISWCSYPNALPGRTAITRSPGCECIGKAYLGFVLETMGNASVTPLVNTTLAARDKYGDEVTTCFDRRLVSRTQSCGLVCSTHLAGLVLYVNSITFLALCTYLLFSEHTILLGGFSSIFTQLFLLKTCVIVLAVALALPFVLRDPEANILNLTGIALSVVYLTLTLHDELNFPAMDKSKHFFKRRFIATVRKPHPLTVTLLLHLQLILPAYGGLIAVSGYARDTWAIISFAGTLWLIGLVMQVILHEFFWPLVVRRTAESLVLWQRFFWTFWYSDRDDSLVNQTSLTVVFLALWILTVLLFTAYYYGDSLYLSGSIWLFCILAVYLVLMMALLIGDRVQMGYMEESEYSFYFSFYQQVMLLLTIILNVIFTTVALVDVTRNTL